MNNFNSLFEQLISLIPRDQEIETVPYSANSLILMARNLDMPALRVIEEAVFKRQPVTFITSEDLSNRMKNELLVLLTEYEDNDDNKSLHVFRIFKIFGYSIIILGFGFVLYSAYLHFFGNNPVDDTNSVIRFFIPLLAIYLGFVLVDFMDKQLIKRYKTRQNLKIHGLKRRQFKSKAMVTVLDEKIGYLTLNKRHYQFNMNPQIVDLIAQMIVMTSKMTKKDRILEKDTTLWLYKD